MSEVTGIAWTTSTFNAWWGCTKVSPGCDHCYAEREAHRRGTAWGPDAKRRILSDAYWREPLKWNARRERQLRQVAEMGETEPGAVPPHRVFCSSMADIFDKDGPQDQRERLWALIRATPHLTWQLLTKRIGNAKRMLPADWDDGYSNVWLGATVVTQEEADRDVPKLLATPARVRFLSCEPLLGPIDLTLDGLVCGPCPRCIDRAPDWETNVVECRACDCTGKGNEWAIDWIIVGGESGPGARPFDVTWARSIVQQCRAAGVAVFVKQLGANVRWNGCSQPGEHWPDGIRKTDERDGGWRVHLVDRKGGDWNEWPEDLRVREFPEAA
jgi:protein gp37